MKKHVSYFVCLTCILVACTSCEKSDKPRTGIVTFYGTVTDKQGTPLNNVQIRIGGTDTPGSSTITGADGTYECPLSIIPTEKKETLTFVIAAKKQDAITKRSEDFGVGESDVGYVGLNGETNVYGEWKGPYVAYAAKINVGWDVVDERVSHSFMIAMEQVYTISGTVTDESGQALQNSYLSVVAYNSAGTGNYFHVGSVTTEGDGKYIISFGYSNAMTSTYYFYMSHDGYETAEKRLSLSYSDLGKTFTLDFVLSKK